MVWELLNYQVALYVTKYETYNYWFQMKYQVVPMIHHL